jgi:hypothetical protein
MQGLVKPGKGISSLKTKEVENLLPFFICLSNISLADSANWDYMKLVF